MRFVKSNLDKDLKKSYELVGNNIYSLCMECKRVIKINKTFFGSLHFCE